MNVWVGFRVPVGERFFSSERRPGEHAVAQLAEALRHKPEGRWFKSRWATEFFNLSNPSNHIMSWDLLSL
jgi:hypothetical protein